jgi:hypothetical protein
MKLSNFFQVPYLTITQSPHGLNQNKKALDIVQDGAVGILLAQADGEITLVKKLSDIKQSYFHYKLTDGSYIQYVHALPYEGKTKFKRGEKLGQSTWHHYHVAINVKGKGWDTILNYMDRSIKLRGITGLNPKWTRWSTYPDLFLNLNEMAYIPAEMLPPLDAQHDSVKQAVEWNKEAKILTDTSEENLNRLDNQATNLVTTKKLADYIMSKFPTIPTGGISEDDVMLLIKQENKRLLGEVRKLVRALGSDIGNLA